MAKKRTVILIDGVDGVGKTTVCNLLAEKTGYPIIKMPNMPKYFDSNPEEMARLFNETIIQFPGDMILDRGYPTSLVYSKIYGRDIRQLDYVSSISSHLKPKVFILSATDKDILSRKNADELIDNEKRVLINKEYVEFGRMMNWNVIDTSNLEAEDVCKKILESL
jgi:thymidylate kinase